jgi:UDP-N-acetyl-D-mannosaminuronate dehydrogenase
VTDTRVSVVGLGKLGCCLAVVLASKGFNVTGADVDDSKVEAINSGVSPIRARAAEASRREPRQAESHDRCRRRGR